MNARGGFRAPALVALLVVLPLAACGSGPAPAPSASGSTAAWLARFADAMKFVPDGMWSWSFSDYRGLDSRDGQPLAQFTEVQCGRNFESPRDIGTGRHEGVTVEDWGTNPIPAERRKDFVDPQTAIDGVDVWAYRTLIPSLRDVPFRAAVVEQRFVVIATSEALLRQALRRTGEPRFGSLEPLPEIEATTVHLVVRDLADKPPPSAPGISAVAALSSTPWRVRTWGRDAEGLHALTRFCFGGSFAMTPRDRIDGVSSFDLSPLHDPEFDAEPAMGAHLGLHLFFGLLIFV